MTEPKPFFSVVMASFLGDYKGNYGSSAVDRETKFVRAVETVLHQECTDWELIIVADGCELTWANRDRWQDPRIRFLKIPKQRLWSELVRNAGIHKARGLYIAYLDTDDRFMEEHLREVKRDLIAANMPDWAVMDDWAMNPETQHWYRRVGTMDRSRGAGTSQIVHKSHIYWPQIIFRHPYMGYDHDEQFFQHLKRRALGVKLPRAGGYQVCHIPRLYDV